MRIGEVTLTNRNLTIEIRGFSVELGPRIILRLRNAWEAIPLNAFWDLIREISQNFVSWSNLHLQTSSANRIFSQEAGRGFRHQFISSTVTLSSENPQFIFLSIEIDRSR